MKRIILIICLFFGSLFANEFDKIISKISQDAIEQKKLDQQRERDFIELKDKQENILKEAKKKIEILEAQSKTLENETEANANEIKALEESLVLKTENLGELFGVAKQASNDLFQSSSLSILRTQYAFAPDFLNLTKTTKLPSSQELETLWLTYLKEIIDSGAVAQYKTKVVLQNGDEVDLPVTRIGLFSVFADGKFLNYDNEILSEYAKQPTSFVKYAKNLDSGVNEIAIDPTRGSLFGVEALRPDLQERVIQGGQVGYVIVFIGILGLLVSIFQYLRLFSIKLSISKQIKNLKNLNKNNPLGRVLIAVNNENDPNQLEAKLNQAVIKEMPKIESMKGFIKLLASVAPMLGLLGTVVGMIATFQAITIFGTGDPKLMADGISQALITTVLGLVVAIPLLFSYAMLNSKSQVIMQILYEQSAGLLVQKEVD